MNNQHPDPQDRPYINLLTWTLVQSGPVRGDLLELYRILAAGRYGVDIRKERFYGHVLLKIHHYILNTHYHWCDDNEYPRQNLQLLDPLYDALPNTRYNRHLIAERVFYTSAQKREELYFKCFANVYGINLLVFREPNLGRPIETAEIYVPEQWNEPYDGTYDDPEEKAVACVLDGDIPLFGIYRDSARLDWHLIKYEHFEEINGRPMYRNRDRNVQPIERPDFRARIVELIRRNEIEVMSMFEY